MESMSYCMVENTTRALQELVERIEIRGEDFLRQLGPYERACYPRLIKLCKQIIELHEEENYQKIVDSWNEDREVQSAIEYYKLIDSIEDDE